ncbi:protealysin inhibitor emfourin [Cellulomonas sp. URHD0024]|uniref:protealysin inhibitor emfourin n=1 Tax=Cellulomonas sp. URHD0024 TaxID=1302620 RepID=UPI00040E3CC1|nr:protealysin inhibitor emfourin [Cellulomonas sp. URHD0024]
MTKKLTLVTVGGMAAAFAAPPTVVHENDLDDDARHHLHRLVAAADDARTGADEPGQLRDAQSYQISIEADDEPPVVLSATDGSVSPQFAQLRDWIRDNGSASA